MKRFSTSYTAYLRFSEFTIQCLHATVPHLNEQDQRLPADRPYTNGYFVDLVAQIRQYAAMMAANRERIQARLGSKMTESEKPQHPSTDRLTLEGGISKTGQPAELVMHREGKAISLRTGLPFSESSVFKVPSIKRTLSNSSDKEGVERSMARRKKDAPPMDINQKCSSCDKVFKRPCDLTKHEKTHSRPWKCTDSSCKYFEVGWPTEKERDRHINDKHSTTPELYTCIFHPCTYQSKRESNCKQHMEKAHGWEYKRSKQNGKPGSSRKATPRASTSATPNSNSIDISTPVTGPSVSPFELPVMYPQNEVLSLGESSAQIGCEDFQLFPDGQDQVTDIHNLRSFPTASAFEGFGDEMEINDLNELSPTTLLDVNHRASLGLSLVDPLTVPPMIFDNSPLAPTEASLNFDADWKGFETPNFEEDHRMMNMQLLTPAQSEPVDVTNFFSRDHSISMPSPLPHEEPPAYSLSPTGKGNLMLYSPPSDFMDEGLADMYDCGYQGKDETDFTLYDDRVSSGAAAAAIDMSNVSSWSAMPDSSQMFPAVPSQEQQGFSASSWAAQHSLPDSAELAAELEM